MRLLGTLTLLLALTACGDGPGPSEERAGPDEASESVAGEPTDTAASAGLEEVPPGYDESPDGAPPVADDELDDAALRALLRTRASVRSTGQHCRADQVRVSFEGFDAALGHRFTRLVVRNVSQEACAVEGVPGIGVRGGWGSTFVPEVRSDDRAVDGRLVPPGPVRLAPGRAASSDVEWSGALAGAETERASLVVVQLASGQVPAATPARLAEDPPSEPMLDIGQFTSIELSPFEPAR